MMIAPFDRMLWDVSKFCSPADCMPQRAIIRSPSEESPHDMLVDRESMVGSQAFRWRWIQSSLSSSSLRTCCPSGFRFSKMVQCAELLSMQINGTQKGHLTASSVRLSSETLAKPYVTMEESRIPSVSSVKTENMSLSTRLQVTRSRFLQHEILSRRWQKLS